MIARLELPTYSYSGNNVVSVGAILRVYPLEGAPAILEYQVSASYDITAADFPAEISRQLVSAAGAYLAKLVEVDAYRALHFPAAEDFDAAATQLLAAANEQLLLAMGGN